MCCRRAGEAGGCWGSIGLAGYTVGAVGVDGVESWEEGGWGVASGGRAWAAAFVDETADGALRGGVGGKRGVGLGRLAGENVEGGVDGDFEVASFAGFNEIRFG